MRYNGSYKLDISSYGGQGTQITVTRKFSFASLAVIMGLGASGVYAYIYNQDSSTYRKCLFFTMVLAVSIYVMQLLRQIQKETLLILSSLGVTVKKESLFSSTTRYYDRQHIEDIVIVEAVSLHSVVFQLILLPKSSCDIKEDKLYPLFQTFQPSLEDLKAIYRHVHTSLVPPGQPHKRPVPTGKLNDR